MYLSQALVPVFGKLVGTLVNSLAAQPNNNFGFSQNVSERVWVEGGNLEPRQEVKTIVYFRCPTEPWRSPRGDIRKYTATGMEVHQMRQAVLTISIFSKVQPLGVANDVANFIHGCMNEDTLDEWRSSLPTDYQNFELESLEPPVPLHHLASGGWNQRIQMVAKFNFRDRLVPPADIVFTRVPGTIADVPSIVPVVPDMKNPWGF